MVRYLVRPSRWTALNRLLCTLAAAQGMELMAECWPRETEIGWVMLILLGLAFLMARQGFQKNVQGGILLWWFTAALIGSVVFSGLLQLDPEKISLDGLAAMGERELILFEVLVVPCIFERKGEKSQGLLILLPVICGVSAQGILGKAAFSVKAPFYDLSRSIRLLGVFDRMEAMAWLGLMLGAFLYLSALTVGALGQQEEKTPLWKAAIIGGAVILLWQLPINLEIPIVLGLMVLIMDTVYGRIREKNLRMKKKKEI